MTDNYEDERSLLEEPKKNRTAIINMAITTGIVIVGVIAIYFVLTASKKVEREPERKPTLTESVPDYKLSFPKPEIVKKDEPKPVPENKPVPKGVSLAPVIPVIPQVKKDPLLERLLTEDLGSDKGNRSSGGSANIRQSNVPASGSGSQYQNIDFSATATPMVEAYRLPNLTWLVPKGTPILCSLNMAIQSDQSGLLTCTTTEDVYGSDGTTILIDRGSTVTGEYRSGSLKLGMERIFVIWDRVRTPDGTVVYFNSPGSGPLGRAGIGGYVDNHYLERFGSAILISLINDTLDEETGSGDSGFTNTSDSMNDSMGQVLSEYAKIKPTLHRAQGGEVNILVARDLDLSKVYDLKYAK